MTKINTDHINQAMEPVMSRMENRHWSTGKAEALGGAGAALAIVLVLLQIKLEDRWRVAALSFSALSIPLWIAIAHISSSREMWNLSHSKHPSLSKYVAAVSLFFLIAGVMLIASMCCLLASFHPPIAGAFFALCLVIACLVGRHTLQVQRLVLAPDR